MLPYLTCGKNNKRLGADLGKEKKQKAGAPSAVVQTNANQKELYTQELFGKKGMDINLTWRVGRGRVCLTIDGGAGQDKCEKERKRSIGIEGVIGGGWGVKIRLC